MSDSRRSSTREVAILLALVGLGITALWLRFNVEPPGHGRPLPHDLVYYFLPQLDLAGQRLAAGELPLWNPNACAGIPLLGSLQVAVFYPGTWLSAVLPADRALPLLVFLHLLLGGAASSLLFRHWGLAPTLSAGFGVVFAFACLLGQSFWPPEVATIAWAPFLLLCTEHVMAGTRTDRWWLGLAVGTALQLLAGFPQFVVYGLQLLVPLALLRGIQRRLREGSNRTALAAGLRVAAALILGLGIAMVQLAPSFEVLSASDRSENFSEAEVHYLQSQPRLGRLLANAVDPEPRLTSYEFGQGAGYLGIGTLVLAGLALVGRRRDPLAWCLAAAAGLWLVLSDGYLGVASEFYRLYAAVPPIASFRAPERLLFPAFTCLIALAALGAQTVDRAANAPRSQRLGLATTALGLALAIALAGSSGAAWRGGVAAGWVAGMLLLPAATSWRAGWRAVGALLLVADIAAATGAFGSLRDLPDELATRMRAGRHEMLSDAELARIRESAGHSRVEFFAPGRQIRPLMGIGAAGGLHRLACYETLLPGQWPALSVRANSPDYRSAVMSNLDPARFPAIYDAASVTTIVHALPPRRLGGGFSGVEILENADALPRAYLVDRIEVATDDAALERLVRGDFDPRDSVLLDADPGLASSRSIERALPADIVDFGPERVEIAVSSPSEAMLILTDTHAPGWHATVDGERRPIYRANGLFRAVRVSRGEHRVVFEYAPTSLRVGAALSLLSLVAVGGVVRRASTHAAASPHNR
ncbi:MAG: YfhO family protein [Myxococcota bacterium]|nr:YfhO family protein [Myxococcota bacterium]